MDRNETLAVGIPEIDRDHRDLETLYRSVVRALAEERDVGRFARGFRDLIERTGEHFRREERFMAEIGYPDAIQHKIEHDRLERDAADFVYSVTTRYEAYDCSAVARYFWRWLSDHVERHDRAIADFLDAARNE